MNVVKIKGNKNHVSQGTGISSKADINGDKNDIYQGDSPFTPPIKVNGWTKTQIISTLVIGVVGLLFTYIRYKKEINSWFSSVF